MRSGILLQITAAVLAFLVVHFTHFRYEYSWSVFVGTFLPDVLKFGINALKQGTFAVLNVHQDSFYWFLNEFIYNPFNWFSLGFFLVGSTIVLYHFHIVRKKNMEEYDELYVFLLMEYSFIL